MRRLVLTSLATALGSLAFASFDLFIAPDSTSGNYARFDPINRVYLGNVNIGPSNGVAAASSKSWGYYKYANGLVAAVNNFTGERITGYQQLLSGEMAMSADGTRLASTYALGMNIFNCTNPLVTSVASYSPGGSFQSHGVIAVSSNRWMMYGLSAAGNLDMYLMSSTGTVIASSTNVISSANLSAAGSGGLGQGSSFIRTGVERVIVPYRDNTGAHRILSIGIGFTTPTSQALTGFSGANAQTRLASVAGHQGFYIVGADSTTSSLTRIQEFDDLAPYGTLQNYTTNAFSSPLGTTWRMSNLVAPEPGTMAALGLGLAALLKRRKK